MKQNGVKRCIYIIVVMVILCSIAVSACDKQNGMLENPTNRGILNFRDFYISAKSVNLTTYARGTIFVKGDPDKPEERHVQIAAWVEIDPEDWGGVSFRFSEGWEVTTIATDYPQGNPTPEYHSGVWTNGTPEQGGISMVRIGHNFPQQDNEMGGRGSVVIEIDYVYEEHDIPEILEVVIGVGSQGDVVNNPVWQKIEVPLNIDYRPYRPAVFFPVQREAPTNVMTALLLGELVLDNGFLRVNDELILWPYGYWWKTEGEKILIINDEGEIAARVGEQVKIGGGEISASFANEKVREFLSGIPGPFWLAGEVSLP